MVGKCILPVYLGDQESPELRAVPQWTRYDRHSRSVGDEVGWMVRKSNSGAESKDAS